MTPEQKEWLKRPTVWPPSICASPEGSKWWEFTAEYQISLPPPFFPLTLIIPVGWRYDRSSIPSWVPPFIMDRDKLGTLAPAPHDAGFKVRGHFVAPDFPDAATQPFVVNGDGEAVSVKLTRAQVDTNFLLYLLRQRIPTARSYAAYYAVRAWWGFREMIGSSKRW